MVRKQSFKISTGLAKQITYLVQFAAGKAWKDSNSDRYAIPNVNIFSILPSCINFQWYASYQDMRLSKLIYFPVCFFRVNPATWLIVAIKINFSSPLIDYCKLLAYNYIIFINSKTTHLNDHFKQNCANSGKKKTFSKKKITCFVN